MEVRREIEGREKQLMRELKLNGTSSWGAR